MITRSSRPSGMTAANGECRVDQNSIYAPRLIQQMRYCSRAHTVSVKWLVVERHFHVWAIKTWLLKCQEPHQMLSNDKTVLQVVWELTTHLFIYSFIHCIMSAFDESAWLHRTWQPRVAVEGRLVASVWVQINDSSREDAGWAAVMESLCTQSK